MIDVRLIRPFGLFLSWGMLLFSIVSLKAAGEPLPHGRVETVSGDSWDGFITCRETALLVQTADRGEVSVELAALRRLVLEKDANQDGPAPLGGSGLLGFYYAGTNFQGSPIIRLDSSIHFDWGWNISPLPGFRQDLFSIRWTGQLQVPRTDLYTISLGSDDGARFWLNGQGPFSMWWRQDYSETNCTMRLEAGHPYDLRVEYFDYFGTARVDLNWSSSAFQKTPIAKEHLYPVSLISAHQADIKSGTGFLASYHAGGQFGEPSMSRIDPAISLDQTLSLPESARAAHEDWIQARRLLRERSSGSEENFKTASDAYVRATAGQGKEIVSGIAAAFFTARWSGWLIPPETGVYSFRLLTDEGARLWLDDELVVDHWDDVYPGEYRHHAKLEGGRPVALRIETLNSDGQIVAKLFWTQPGQEETLLEGANISPSLPEKSPTKTAEESLPPGGIVLSKGTFLPMLPEGLDTTSLRLGGPVLFLSVPRPRIAQIYFSPLGSNQLARLPADRTGALLDDGDFVEGDVLGIKGTEVRIDSVLFGRRSFHAPGPITALVMKPAPSVQPVYKLVVRGLGEVTTPDLRFGSNGITVPELMSHTFRLEELIELTRIQRTD